MLLKCSKCGREKDAGCFSKRKRSKTGHSAWCRACASEYYRQYYLKNSVALCKKSNDWKKENPERNRETIRIWTEKNKKKVREKAILWKKNNPEKVAESQRRYRKKHPEKQKEIRKNRNARVAADLTDHYVKGAMSTKLGLKYGEITPGMVELKRAQLLLHREVKNGKNKLKHLTGKG